MKTAVVFYSLGGNCALAAAHIGSALNADIIRVRTVDEKKRSRMATFFWGGGMVFLGKKPALKPCAFDPSLYDLVIVGAPVWAGTPAPPVKSFLAEHSLAGKKTAFFLCHAGGPGKAREKFRTLLSGSDIIAETDFNSAAAGDTERLAAEWVKSFLYDGTTANNNAAIV